jgi:cell division septation protein DedD
VTRNRLIYMVAFPAVALGLCLLAYFMGYSRGKQAALLAPSAPQEALVPAEHEASGDLTFFKTLREPGRTDDAAPAPAGTPMPPLKPLHLASADEIPSGSFAVQVSAFKDIGKAHELADNLKNKGHSAYVISGKTKGQEWHRVYVGPYASKEKAQEAMETLQKDGFHQGFVTTFDPASR